MEGLSDKLEVVDLSLVVEFFKLDDILMKSEIGFFEATNGY